MPTRRYSVLLALAVASTAHAQMPSAPETGKPSPNRKCELAEKRLAKEQKLIVELKDEIAQDKKARESCGTAGACLRFDNAIKGMETRLSKHGPRLEKLQGEVEKACKPA